MKKIFTLALGLIVTVAMFAADHRPQVLLNSARNFQVVIDGQMVSNQGRTAQLNFLGNGRHSIKVYEVRRGFFGAQRRLVSQSNFRLRGNDMKIRVDNNGEIMFKVSRDFGRNGNGFGRDRNSQNDDYGWDRGQDNRDYRYNQKDRDRGWEMDLNNK